MARLGAFAVAASSSGLKIYMGGTETSIGLVFTALALMAMAAMAVAVCAQSAASRKNRNSNCNCNCHCHGSSTRVSSAVISSSSSSSANSSSSEKKMVAPKSPLRAVVSTLSNKKLLPWGRSSGEHELEEEEEDEDLKKYDREVMEHEGGFLWQRTILMGEKCQPPDFSGVIYYDEKGNIVPSLPPRSPRFTPVSSFHTSCEVR